MRKPPSGATASTPVTLPAARAPGHGERHATPPVASAPSGRLAPVITKSTM